MELIEQFKQYMSEGKGLEQQAYKDEIKISCAKNDDEKLNAMKENIASFAVEDTNRLIYEGVKKLVENKKR